MIRERDLEAERREPQFNIEEFILRINRQVTQPNRMDTVRPEPLERNVPSISRLARFEL